MLVFLAKDNLFYINVKVGSSHKTEGVDYSLESIHNMKEALPELWESAAEKADVSYSGKAAIEAAV